MPDWDDEYGGVTSRYYDAAYAQLASLSGDATFYRELAVESGGPVLEIGCGTGRVLLPIAEAGVACAGIDSSQAMLDVLRSKSGAERVRLVRARMQDFALLGGRFALIYSAFRAFQHLYTIEDQLHCLANVRAHLVPGGSFAFDVFNPKLDVVAVDVQAATEDLRFEDAGDEMVRSVAQTRDRVSQLIHLDMRYERRRAESVVSIEHARFRLRWFTRFELQHLMARAGFTHVAVYGDFDRSPVRADSPALVVVATH
jgi:SAM-dependent methyltransferase